MAVTLTAQQMQHTKASNAYEIKNPQQTKNSFTIKDASEAAKALNLGKQEQISQLKDFLKGYDMTSISTDELKTVGAKLYEHGLIDTDTFTVFITGDGATDANGQQAHTDVKFNAIALFNERRDDHVAYFANDHYSDKTFAASTIRGLTHANQAINALAYFANSSHDTLLVSERA